MENKLNKKALAKVQKVSEALARNNATTEEKYSPISTADTNGDSEARKSKEIQKDKPVPPTDYSGPIQSKAKSKSKKKDKGRSL